MPTPEPAAVAPAQGRYALYDVIGTGGMATVHIGVRRGDAGFSRVVAIKRLSPQGEGVLSMMLDEARVASRIAHANVVATIDVVAQDGELFVVMEYVHGVSLHQILRLGQQRGERVPPHIARAIVSGMLRGLHAAHEARSDDGQPLGVIHRDVSPSNVLVGADGVPRLVDFGIAKFRGQTSLTQTGEIKGKVAFMSPEQLGAEELDRRTDVWSAGVVLWESFVGTRLFSGQGEEQVIGKVLAGNIAPPSTLAPGLDPRDDAVVMRALGRNRDKRFPTAKAMADAIDAIGVAPQSEVSAWLERFAGAELRARQATLDAVGSTPPVLWTGGADPAPVLAVVRTRRRGVPKSAFAAVVATGAAVLVALVVSARSASSPPSSAPAASAPVASAALSPPSARELGPTGVEAPPEPLASASQPTAAEPSSASARPKPRPRAVSAPTAAPDNACSPPFEIDADGHKRHKPECFR